MKVLFLDTNIFLQCKDIEQLPWGEIVQDKDVLLLIPRSVSEEIDRLKQDGNTRRAKRSRKTSSFFKSILLSEDLEITIRNSNPVVKISFAPVSNNKIDLPGVLDLSRTDDRIIAEAISYKNAQPDGDVAILTHDTNLILTSRHCGLPFMLIPDEWLSPPEPDPRDKKIVELENRLKILEKSLSEIEIKALDDEGNPIESLDIEIACYKELQECELKELVSMVEAVNPKVTNFDNKPIHLRDINLGIGGGYVYEPPKQKAVEEYLNEKYPNWLIKVEKYFQSLHFKFESPHRYIKTLIMVNNVGRVPAEDVTVEFRVFDGLRFAPPGRKLAKPEDTVVIKLPSAPKPPEGKFVLSDQFAASLISTLAQAIPQSPMDYINMRNLRDLSYPPIVTPRDKNSFYWQDDSPPISHEDKWIFECEEFLHHQDPELFNITVVIPTNIRIDTTFKIECRVLVRNLPEPIIYRFPVNVKFKEKDLFEKIKKLTETKLSTPSSDDENSEAVESDE